MNSTVYWSSYLNKFYTEQYNQNEDDCRTTKLKRIQMTKALRARRIEPKPPEDISYSIHDPEAAYRKKGQGVSTQTVSDANITDVMNTTTSVEVLYVKTNFFCTGR